MSWDWLRSSYDGVAEKYEARFLDELAGKPRDRELLEAFAATVDDPIVEIGCGPGHIGAFVRAQGHAVVGLDLSERMAALAARRLDAALTADLRRLPLADSAVGGLIAFYSLIHVERGDLADALSEFARALRPGGRVLFSAHEGVGVIERDEFLDEPVPFVATFFQLDELVAAARAADLDVVLAERRESYAAESGTVRLYVEAQRRSVSGRTGSAGASGRR